jgi:hypothetical protein
MARLHHLTTAAAPLLLAVTLAVTGHSGPDASGSGSWGSSFAIRDPDPGFWRDQPGELAGEARPYSVGMSSLAAMTRITIAPGHDLELTNLGTAGAVLLESGGLVLANAEGSVALQRAGATTGDDPEPADSGAMLLRGDRIVFRSSATVALRNPEATAATLLLATEIADIPSAVREVRATSHGAAHRPDGSRRGPLLLAHES